MTAKNAIAVFVKTPGYSRLKTRLANAIGESLAIDFFQVSCKVLADRLLAFQKDFDIAVYWSVAEKTAVFEWSHFPAFWQGEGGLGDRLHMTYDLLLTRHQNIFFIGADCPHIDLQQIVIGTQLLETHSTVMADAQDGGFALFGGNRSIERCVWNSVIYSRSDTGHSLKTQLEQGGGQVGRLAQQFDIDEVGDLAKLALWLQCKSDPVFDPIRKWFLINHEILGKKAS